MKKLTIISMIAGLSISVAQADEGDKTLEDYGNMTVAEFGDELVKKGLTYEKLTSKNMISPEDRKLVNKFYDALGYAIDESRFTALSYSERLSNTYSSFRHPITATAREAYRKTLLTLAIVGAGCRDLEKHLPNLDQREKQEKECSSKVKETIDNIDKKFGYGENYQ